MKILITGGSGMIGQELSKTLISKGYKVSWLSRSEDLNASIPKFGWDINQGLIDPTAFEMVDVVIHLAGKNIGSGRWTSKFKKEILHSRVASTTLLMNTINKLDTPPKMVICASAIGYYGDTGNEWVDEDSSGGDDFLAHVVKKWEEAMDLCKASKLIKLRLGVVLNKNGGALPKMTMPIKLGLGSNLGNGKQWISWISLNDIIALVEHVINDDTPAGIYNAVSPFPITNEQLMKRIAKYYHRPTFLPGIPKIVLKLLLGESSALVLNSNRVKTIHSNLAYVYKSQQIEDVL